MRDEFLDWLRARQDYELSSARTINWSESMNCIKRAETFAEVIREYERIKRSSNEAITDKEAL